MSMVAVRPSNVRPNNVRPFNPALRRMYLTRVRDFVEGTQFPASRAKVVAFARRNNTPSAIMTDLVRLSADSFSSLDEVVASIDALEFSTSAH